MACLKGLVGLREQLVDLVLKEEILRKVAVDDRFEKGFHFLESFP